MTTDVIIESIVRFLIYNAETLSKDKFSGVHYIEDWGCYRVHRGHFLPTFLNSPTFTIEIDKSIVNCLNSKKYYMLCEYSKNDGWLTIWKN